MQDADTPVHAPPDQTPLDFRVAGFQRAWQALPATVEHVVVLRDTTITTQRTLDCIVRVVDAGTQATSRACPLARSVALREDAAAVAARRMRSPRYDVIDLSRHPCGPRAGHPVVGGVLVKATSSATSTRRSCGRSDPTCCVRCGGSSRPGEAPCAGRSPPRRARRPRAPAPGT